MKNKSILYKIVMYLILILLTSFTLMPLLWMLSASIKTDSEVFSMVFHWFPEVPQWQNYMKIWNKIPLATFTFNSVKLTVIITLIQVATSSFAAYGFSKCKFKGRDVLFLLYVATIAIPWQVYMLPQYSMMNKMHLVDSHLGYVLMQSFTAFGVFLMRQFFMSLPNELLEAGRIDGLSEYGNYFRIALPLAKPSIATLTIFSFVTIWNDYMGPMIYFNSTENKTIQLGIKMFIAQYSAEYGLVMAASVLSLIPVLAIFLGGQKFFVQGIASSGIKG
ncbi:MAG: carbohydrate ABC transporter permease [Lachnospiraceae bacterium]|nr:carbohydrate ABC transporter permease [Lachnospiraceae bacterium]MDE7007181.1 carbohydrate ABC transporter permease [Lachnospiraceae bacterium]